MRLLTYNIHYWAGLDGQLNVEAVIQLLRESQADVIGLNEVLHPLRTPLGDRYPLLDVAEALGMYWAFGPTFQQGTLRFWPGTLGNAVLSRYPIRHVQNIPLQSVAWRKPRSLFQAVVDVEGVALTVFVTHLDHLLAPVRRRQFETIADRLRQTRGPHVLMGDLNTHTPVRSRIWQGETVIRHLRALGYVDAFAAVGRGDGRSYPTRFPLARLDYIWVPRAWAAALRGARVITSTLARRASDHFPVWVEWRWLPTFAAADLTPAWPHGEWEAVGKTQGGVRDVP